MRFCALRLFSTAVLIVLPLTVCVAQAPIPTPADILGFRPGDDYRLASYEDSIRYFQALDASSDRMMMREAGTTTGGRTMHYAVISSPDNLADWENQKAIGRRLADSRDLDDTSARALAKEARIIVHIDGGLHSSEAMTHQMPLPLAHTLVSTQGDPVIDAILDNVIVVLWPTLNPDGQTMIADWYRGNVGTPHETSPMPWLYQEYVGHDNNRDGYMLNMLESQVVTRAAQDYSPAIFYTQHHKAPFPARIWVPPFADPISANVSPYMRVWTNVIGINMMAAFEAEQKPGVVSHVRWDNWYPGYLDYTHVFRHTISYFTETALHEYATPQYYRLEDFPEADRALQVGVLHPSPWAGGWWRPADAVSYMMTASISTLDTAARYREILQYNRYQSARDTIRLYSERGPHAWVIPETQHDPGEAADLVQRLLDQQIEIYQAGDAIELGGTVHPAGSWVIPMDQPFARLVQELFERQRHPGKKDSLPHDTTGWTLPLQMGVDVVPINAALTQRQRAGLQRIEWLPSGAGGISGSGPVYLLERNRNASYRVLNALLAEGAEASFTADGSGIALTGIDRERVQAVAAELDIPVRAVPETPDAAATVRRARVGLYRPWKPSMDEGWTRWLLEQYGYEPVSLYNADMRAGNLADRVDVLILPDISRGWLLEGFSEPPGPGSLQRLGGAMIDPVSDRYAGGIGEAGVTALRAFVSGGGTLVTFNGAARAAIDVLDLPVADALADVGSDQFFVSGALLEIELARDTLSQANKGMLRSPAVMFESSPVFVPKDGFRGHVLATYPAGRDPLLSGIIHGPEHLHGQIAALDVEYGEGRVYLYGFRPQWRGQSHGTYKFVFNTLYDMH